MVVGHLLISYKKELKDEILPTTHNLISKIPTLLSSRSHVPLPQSLCSPLNTRYNVTVTTLHRSYNTTVIQNMPRNLGKGVDAQYSDSL